MQSLLISHSSIDNDKKFIDKRKLTCSSFFSSLYATCVVSYLFYEQATLKSFVSGYITGSSGLNGQLGQLHTFIFSAACLDIYFKYRIPSLFPEVS